MRDTVVFSLSLPSFLLEILEKKKKIPSGPAFSQISHQSRGIKSLRLFAIERRGDAPLPSFQFNSSRWFSRRFHSFSPQNRKNCSPIRVARALAYIIHKSAKRMYNIRSGRTSHVLSATEKKNNIPSSPSLFITLFHYCNFQGLSDTKCPRKEKRNKTGSRVITDDDSGGEGEGKEASRDEERG